MVKAIPAPSLRELARPKGVTEGVSSVGCSGPTIYTPAHINSEIFECLRSSKYTPSVSHSLDSSLREGAGNGCGGCAIHPTARKPEGCGRFSSPLRKLWGFWFLPFIGGHSLSLAFARQLPQRGSRERLGGLAPFNRVLAKPEGCGRFSSPLRRLRMFYISPYIVQRKA